MYSKMAMITFFDAGEAPTNPIALPPVSPSQGLPGSPVYPSQGLPPGAVTLPVFPFDPTLPSNELPGIPGLPSTGPIVPGRKFVVKWLACHGLILVPDQTLPGIPPPPIGSPV
jgi:hypothetical protein